mgnify:CR=1 FL=1
MRAYTVEELTGESAGRIAAALNERGLAGPIEGIWFLPVPQEFLDQEQRDHAEDCGPHVMAVELVERPTHTDVRMELLVRARGRIRCSCIRYAPPALREHMIDHLDALIRELDIPV